MKSRYRKLGRLGLLAAMLMLIGCAESVSGIGPGECVQFYSTTAVYIQLPEHRYMKVSQELGDTMVLDPEWTAPAGITIEDAVVRAVPSEVRWELGDAYYSAEGAVIKTGSFLCAADQLTPQSAELKLRLPMMAHIAEKSGGSFQVADVPPLAIDGLGIPDLAGDTPSLYRENATFVPPDTIIVGDVELRDER